MFCISNQVRLSDIIFFLPDLFAFNNRLASYVSMLPSIVLQPLVDIRFVVLNAAKTLLSVQSALSPVLSCECSDLDL